MWDAVVGGGKAPSPWPSPQMGEGEACECDGCRLMGIKWRPYPAETLSLVAEPPASG